MKQGYFDNPPKINRNSMITLYQTAMTKMLRDPENI